MTGMDPMSAQDAMFLHVEDDVTPMHIGGVSIFEGPPPPFAEVRDMVARKLHHTPRYRQKVRLMPLGAGRAGLGRRPVLRARLPPAPHRACPAPGDDDQLRAMAARVFSQHLDRARPLWELWMVEGLRGRRWALLSKVHHCMVDGVAATDLMSVMFDDEGARRGRAAVVAAAARALAPRARHAQRHAARPRPARRRCAPRCGRPCTCSGAPPAPRGPSPRPRPPCGPATSSLTGPIGPTPRVELGQGAARATSRPSAPRSAARSTTSS